MSGGQPDDVARESPRRPTASTASYGAPQWWLGWPVAAVLIALYLAMAYSAVSGKSNVFDEALHMTAGYSYWKLDDFRIQPENGNLPQRLFGLPLVLGEDLAFPSTGSRQWQRTAQWTVAYRFFFDLGNDFRSMLARSRAVAVCIGAGILVLIYTASRRLFGPGAALLSLALAAFSPNLLAHGPLATSDAALVLLLPGFLGVLWLALHRATPGTWLASSTVAALLFLTKFSAPIAIPMAMLLAAIRIGRGEPWSYGLSGRGAAVAGRGRQLALVVALVALHIVVIWAAVWAAYDFRYAAMAESTPESQLFDSWEDLLEAPGPVTPLVAFAREHELLPEAYLYGVAFVNEHTRSRFAFLAGEFSLLGWWWFFPYAFAIKTPIGVFGLLTLSAAAVWKGVGREGSRASAVYRCAPIWVLLAVYWATSLTANVNVGLRHMLPTYPALFILAGPAARWIATRHRIGTTLVITCLAAVVFASWNVRPHYLAYFNSFVGGPARGYRHLVDSSLDWGQDLPELAQWLEANAEPGVPVYLSYFGSSSPPAWGVEALRLPSYHDWPAPGGEPAFALRGGLYCISATMLQGVYLRPPGPWTGSNERRYQARRELVAPILDPATSARRRNARLRDPAVQTAYREFATLRYGRLAAYLRKRTPDAQIGYSIQVFRLGDDEVHDALYGPPVQLAPELSVPPID